MGNCLTRERRLPAGIMAYRAEGGKMLAFPESAAVQDSEAAVLNKVPYIINCSIPHLGVSKID